MYICMYLYIYLYTWWAKKNVHKIEKKLIITGFSIINSIFRQ